MNILICGSRDFNRWNYFRSNMDVICDSYNLLDQMRWTKGDITIISGCAKGADTLAIQYAQLIGANVKKYPAMWDKYGPRAGPIRNQQMLDEGKPDLVVAFPTDPNNISKGTRDMIDRSIRAGVEVIIVGA